MMCLERPAVSRVAPPVLYVRGEQADLEANLIFLRARYSRSCVGRFMSRDPVWGIADVPETINRYPYAKNNPVVYLDSDGEFVIAAISRCVGWDRHL